MDRLTLKTSLEMMTQILSCEIDETVNQHITAAVSGYVAGEDDALLNQLYQKEFTVRVEQEDGSDKYLFRGIVQEAEIINEGKLKKLTVRAASHTARLDVDKKLRAFQDVEKTYQTVTSYIVSQYSEKIGIIYVPETKGTLPELMVQYRETDWEFLKRLASKLGLALAADIHNSYPCFYFGMPERKLIELEDVTDYQVCCRAQGAGKLEYEMECRQLLGLCAAVKFLGSRFRVYRKKIRLDEGALAVRYTLRREEGFWQEAYEREELTGCSLMGTVKSVREDKVRIELDCEDVRGANSKEYPYATVYSSPDGTGWYCMPEEGDRVRLYFPDGNEDHGYAASAVHLGAVDDKRKNPEEKSIRTIYDKEVRFTPNKILITNHKGMQILLDDEKGIEIKSGKQISLRSSDGIDLISGGKIAVEGENGIILNENENFLIIRDGIRINGLDIQFK